MPEFDARIVDEYRKLLDLSQQLLKAAKSKEWEQSMELERQRTIVVHKLQALPDILGIGLKEQEREVALLIEEILQCDAQSAPLIEAEMADLRERLNSVANERKLGESYL